MSSSKYIAGNLQKKILMSIRNKAASLLELNKQLDCDHQTFVVKKSLKRLESRGIISLSGETVRLTKEGLKLLKSSELEEIKIKETEWDGTWRIVAYDIPEELKKERDYFRRKLTELEFTKIQESMWLYPYECKEEIAIMAQNLRLSPFVMHLKTDYVPQQKALLKKYSL